MDIEFSAVPIALKVEEITYMHVDISWKDDIERIKKTYNGRLRTELSMRNDGSNDWNTIYRGYDVHFAKRNLDSDAVYHFRVRFGNKNSNGKWSDELSIKTLKSPLTGLDILRAVKQYDISKLREVLTKEEANIEAADNLGLTSLMYAAQRNMVEIIEILLEWKANPNTQTDLGKTALMFASFKGNIECMETLIESGAKVDLADKSGLTAFHMATDGEQTRAIKLLAKSGAQLEARDYSMGWTPLLRCAGLKNNGNVNVAHELIRMGAQVDALDNDGKTALHNSIIHSHHQLCQLLLSQGASLNLVTKNGYNAIELAESIGNQKILQAVHEYLPNQRADENRSTN